jgi:hypothetical protein
MVMDPCAAHGSGVSTRLYIEIDQMPFTVDQGMSCNIGQ